MNDEEILAEDNRDWAEYCPTCGDPVGNTSHYHCSVCGELCSMMSHSKCDPAKVRPFDRRPPGQRYAELQWQATYGHPSGH